MTALNYGQEADDRGRAQVELEEYLAGPEPDYDTPEEVRDADRADQLLRVLRAIDRDIADVKAQAARETQRVKDWREEREAALNGRRDHIAGILASWTRATLVPGGPKTISLPNGKLTARAQQAKWKVEDEDEFLAWAERNGPVLTRVPNPVPDMVVIKDALLIPGDEEGRKYAPVTVDGEPVPGLSVTVLGDKYTAVPS